MHRAALILVTGLLLIIAVVVDRSADSVAAQAQRPAGTNFSGKAFRFNKVKDGVYHAIGTGAMTVVGNSTIIVNDRDAIIVDDHVSPAAAWVLLDGAQGDHRQAGDDGRQHALPLRPRARQPDLRAGSRSSATSSRAARCSTTRCRSRSTRASKPQDARGQIETLKKRVRRRAEPGGERKAANATHLDREQLRVAEGAEADTAQRHADDTADAVPRRSRNPDPVSRTRAHRRRCRRLSAEGKGRHHRRPADVEHCRT